MSKRPFMAYAGDEVVGDRRDALETPEMLPGSLTLLKDKIVLPALDLAWAISEPYLLPVRSLVRQIKDVIENPRNQRFVIQLITWVSVLGAGLVLASVAYALFYYAYVPAIGFRQDLYLRYGLGDVPTAHLDFSPAGRYFALDQAYDVTVEMVVPNSDWNIDVGNFMVAIDLKSKGTTVFHSERPTILPYKQPLQRYLSLLRFVEWPFKLAFRGPVMPDSLVLAVPLMEKTYIDQGRRRVDSATVAIGRKDKGQWGEGKGEIRSYSTSIRFDAHFEGLRYMMYYYPLPTFFVFAMIFLFWEIVAAIIVYILIAKPFSARDVNVIVKTTEALTEAGQKVAPAVKRAGQELKREGREGISTAADNIKTGYRAPKRGVELARGSPVSSIKSEDDDENETSLSQSRETEHEEDESSLWSAEDAPAGSTRGTYGTGRERAEDPRRRIKREEDDDDMVTVAGSSTTRPTQRSFGPTLSTASTSGQDPSASRAQASQRLPPATTVSTEASSEGLESGTETE